jgi:hypothetical protein
MVVRRARRWGWCTAGVASASRPCWSVRSSVVVVSTPRRRASRLRCTSRGSGRHWKNISACTWPRSNSGDGGGPDRIPPRGHRARQPLGRHRRPGTPPARRLNSTTPTGRLNHGPDPAGCDNVEDPGAQVLGGILDDRLQTLARCAVVPVPTGIHQSAVQFVSVRLQHLEQLQFPEHREEPVLERLLEPRPVRRVIDEPRQPTGGVGSDRHRGDTAAQGCRSSGLDLPDAGVGLGRQRGASEVGGVGGRRNGTGALRG